MVKVEPGNYPDQNVPRSNHSGTERVVVEAEGAAFTDLAIFGSHVEIRDAKTDGWYVKPGATDVVIRHVISTSPVFVTAASHVRVLGGAVYSASPYVRNGSQLKQDGGVPPRDIVFDGVSFHDFRKDPASSDHVDCLHILAGNGITVRNSRFWNCEHFDILLTRFEGDSPTNVLIENNFFSCCGSGYFSLQLGGGHEEVWQNILVRYNSADKALNIDSANTIGGSVSFLANVTPHLPSGMCSRRGVTIDYNVYDSGPRCGPHDRIGASDFVAPDQHNFHLRKGARAVDAGDPSSSPRRDIDGQRRPAGRAPDAGADELPVKTVKTSRR